MMMSQVARALDASLHGDDVLMTGISKDTRDIHQGDLYIAIKGERFDGHRFVQRAGEAGAAGALVSDIQDSSLPQVQVEDTRLALGALAAYWRDRFCGKMIGITGSNGKTSVKEMCRKILVDHSKESAVLSTRGNLNNDIGMPLMLLELTEAHEYAVIEMGANHVGEIDYLTSIARPDVAIVNNVGPAHLEGFGSLENTAAAKAEIYNGLGPEGVAVINLDDHFSEYWKGVCAGRRTLGFSMLDESADVFARAIDAERYRVVTSEALGSQSEGLTLRVPGRHNVMNALAAITATCASDVPLSSAVVSLSEFENIEGRLTARRVRDGVQIIDDSYNANPLSVSAAIDVLASMAGNKIMVLGDMAELGVDAQRLHREVGMKAKQSGIDRLFATGSDSAYTVEAFGEGGCHFEDKASLIDALSLELGEDGVQEETVILVKGSRSAAMEEVVERILTHDKNDKRVN